MKIITIFTLIISVTLISCGNNNETSGDEKVTKDQSTFDDIKTEELIKPCDCVDAIGMVLDRLIATSDNLKGLEPDSDKREDAEQVFLKGQDKISEITKRCQGELGIQTAEIQECAEYQQMIEKMQLVKQL